MKKSKKTTTNIEQGVPFTVAQQASMGQANAQAQASPFPMDPNSYLPSMAQKPQQAKNPFDVIAQRLQQDQAARALGMGDVEAKMDSAASRDQMKTKMGRRSRWGNGVSDENGVIVPKEILRKGSR